MAISSLKLPPVVGSKLTLIVIEPPAGIVVPATGTPEAPNGADGSLTALIVKGAPPTLRNVAAPDRWPPMVVPPKDTSDGVVVSRADADWPVPDIANELVPALVSA